MTDLSITAANVLPGAGAKSKSGLAGAAIAAGDAVYYDPATDSWKLADNNSATAEVREADGIALNSAAAGQPLKVHTRGPLTVGSVLSAGVPYYLSDTPGKICPYTDLATGEYSCFLGIAQSPTSLFVQPVYSGAAL